jgi:hypothetical protein
MEVICLEDEALYQLVEKVICHIIEKVDVKEDKWLSIAEAIYKLKIKKK